MQNSFAFLFDMDGVIVDSNPAHTRALHQFCEKHGHYLTDQQLREKIYGRANKDWIPNVFGDLSKEQVSAYAWEKEALYRELYTDIREVSGLTPFLKRIREGGFRCAVATSAPRVNVDFTLSRTNTLEYFPVILDEAHVNRGKPDPEIYLNTARAVGLPPGQCIVFEDSLSGIQAARAAGCKVVGITTTHSAQEMTHVDLIINNFEGLDPAEVIRSLYR